jgi:hypothetical protein
VHSVFFCAIDGRLKRWLRTVWHRGRRGRRTLGFAHDCHTGLSTTGLTKIGRIVPSTAKWMPGASLTAVASGGGKSVTYSHGLVIGAGYLVVAIVAAAITFSRKDVTA